MAIILAVGGLLVGTVFMPHSSGIRETAAAAESFLIPQAQGAEVDSAALTVASAPFLASVNSSANMGSAAIASALDAEGAIKDPEAFTKESLKSSASTGAGASKKTLAYGVIYQVAAGDTLSSVANEFNVSENRIIQFNPSVNFSALIPGI